MARALGPGTSLCRFHVASCLPWGLRQVLVFRPFLAFPPSVGKHPHSLGDAISEVGLIRK